MIDARAISNAMRELGYSDADALALICKLQDAEKDDRREKERAKKARYRASVKEAENNASVHDVPVDTVDMVDTKVSPSSSPSSSSPPITPLITTPPSSPPSKNARDARSLAVRAAFDAFWRRWPHKVGKPAAEKAFAKCSSEIEAILLGIDRYIRDKPPDRPWLNPATFLNQRRWEDAPAEISQASRHEPPRKISAITQAIMKLEAEINETQISRDSPAFRQIPVNGELISGGFGVEDQELPRNLERLFG